MSQLVKMKRQPNFKGFKRLGTFKGLVEQKNVFNSFVCQLGLFWHPIYTQTRQINYYYRAPVNSLEQLDDRLHKTLTRITPQMIQGAQATLIRRARLCVQIG
jgi:hypothetical protein